MTTLATTLKLDRLPQRQVSALRSKADSLGMSAEEYVKRLIAEDLALDREARQKSLAELGRPFQKALGDLGEDDLDAVVRSAKAPKRRGGRHRSERTR